MSIRLLHIFSTFAVGGPQRRFATIANGLDGYEHIIAAADGRGDAMSIVGDNCTFLDDFSFQKSKFISQQNLKAVRRLIEKYKPDVLCTYNFGAIEAVLGNRPGVARKPLVNNLHFEDGFGPDETPTIQHKRRVALRQLALGKSQIVVPSEVLMTVAKSRWKMPLDQFIHIDNGIEMDRFGKTSMPTGTNFCIGTLGAIRKEKNLFRMLNVIEQVGIEHNVRLWIAGDGPELPALQAEVKKRGMDDLVHFSGHTDAPETIYSAFDLFMMTSDTEQMPISLIEAMATNLPVVATRVGDIERMVSSENRRFLFDVDDIDGLVWGVKTLIEKPEIRESLGRLNRARAQREFNLKSMLTKYDALFKKMAKGKSA